MLCPDYVKDTNQLLWQTQQESPPDSYSWVCFPRTALGLALIRLL